MNLRPARLLPILVVGLVAPFVAASPGSGAPATRATPGAPIDDLEAQAAALQDKIEENGARVAALGEQLNAAQIKVDEADATIADAEAGIAAGEAETDELERQINDRAAAIYRSAGSDAPLEVIDVEDANDAGSRSKYSDVVSARDEQLVDALAAAREDLEERQAVAEDAREAASKERDELADARAEADAAAAEQQGLLDQVNGEIAEYVEAERAAREEAAAAAAANTPPPSSGGSGPSPPGGGGGPPPPPGGGAGAAVAYAWAQVGKPYCYAGVGPGCYDCSGLTMMAWRQGGISMPHYSGAQGSMFPAVSLSQLQPGDLITTSSWPAHVGIWVGGGYVHATHTGDFIKFVAGSGSVRAAVRPG